MEDGLVERGKSLEELFFLKQDAKLIAERKQLETLLKNKETLSEISGITHSEVLDKLVELGVTPSLLSSLVILPLVEVAWADGEITDKEKAAILEGAANFGIVKESSNYHILEEWLKVRPAPRILKAWIHYVAGLRAVMNQQQLEQLKTDIFNRAKRIAESSGGVMGIAKISSQEHAIIRKMEAVFEVWDKKQK